MEAAARSDLADADLRALAAGRWVRVGHKKNLFSALLRCPKSNRVRVNLAVANSIETARMFLLVGARDAPSSTSPS